MSSYESADFWSQKAKQEGYPARSVYKLKEMDEKFALVRPPAAIGRSPFRVLDLGAAPGSWSLYVLRKFAGLGFLAAVDLSPLSRQYDKGLFDGPNFFFLRGDLTDPAVKAALQAKGPFNLILSDAAPSTTGNRTVDTERSLELARSVVDYADLLLAKSGSLAVKVFQGGDTRTVLMDLKARFATARAFKPETCRAESFETYYLGLNKKMERIDLATPESRL